MRTRIFLTAALFTGAFWTPATAAVDYVKVCSLYGAGWLYIPGTDTCLKSDTGETRQQTEIGTKVGETELATSVGQTEGAVGDLQDAQADTAKSVADLRDAQAATDDRVTNLENRFNSAFSESLDGIAIAMALADPDLVGGEHFAIKLNFGNYSSSNAFGVSFAGVIAQSDKARLTLSGAVATTGSHTGGRVGLQVSW